MSLYTLNQEIENFEFSYDEETGEITNFEMLDHLEMARDEKIENICLFIKNLNADAESIKEEAKALTERAKAKENKANNLEKYLESCLQGAKFESPKCSISYRKSKSVECKDITQVPMEYLVMQDPKLDKKAIKDALNKGIEIPSCSIVEKNNMVIK